VLFPCTACGGWGAGVGWWGVGGGGWGVRGEGGGGGEEEEEEEKEELFLIGIRRLLGLGIAVHDILDSFLIDHLRKILHLRCNASLT